MPEKTIEKKCCYCGEKAYCEEVSTDTYYCERHRNMPPPENNIYKKFLIKVNK